MAFLNQFSFLLLAIGVGFALLVVVWYWRRANPLLRAGFLAWYLLGVLILALVWRYPAAPNLKTASDVDAVLNNGRPTLVMLYSNY